MVRRRAALPVFVCLFALAAPTLAATADPLRPLPPDSPAAAPEPVAPATAPDPAIEQHAPPASILLVVARGDTLVGLLSDAGLAAAEAHAVAAAIAPHLPPRSLRPGLEIVVLPEPTDPTRARAVEIAPDPTRRIRIQPAPAGGYRAAVETVPLVRHLVRAEGVITSSLYEDMRAEGVPSSVIMALIRAFSHAVDFQRDLHPGDRFAVMFERFRDADGALLQHGQGLYAELELRERRLRIWRYTPPGGTPDWFDERGESVRRALLRTPLDAARISSGFGMRRHPILGYSRMHRGVDFAAPAGTPVFAAGDGAVLFAGWRGDYGRTVVLRHAGGIDTLYAHLSAIPPAVRPGARVRQGQVIGRVGATGLATGPHLHYEVHHRGVAVNPASIRILAGRSLQGRELAAFRAARVRLDAQFAALAGVAELAAAE